MAKDSDIQVLVGVSRAGDPSGDSEALIRKQLESIAKKIKLSVQVQLSKDSAKEGSLRTQVQSMLDGIGGKKPLSISVQQIKVSNTALNDFKRQIQAIVNTIDVSKGTSITVKGAGSIGEFAKELSNFETRAESAQKKAAAIQSAVYKTGLSLKEFDKKIANKDESDQLKELLARQRANESLSKKIGANNSDSYLESIQKENSEIERSRRELEESMRARLERETTAEKEASDERVRIYKEEAQKKASLKLSASGVKDVFRSFNKSFEESLSGKESERLSDLRDGWKDLRARIEEAQKAKEPNPEVLAGLQEEMEVLEQDAKRFLSAANAARELEKSRKLVAQEIAKASKVDSFGGGAMLTSQYRDIISAREQLAQMSASGNIDLDTVNKLGANISSNLDLINQLQGVLAATPKGMLGKLQSMFGGITKLFSSARIITTAIKYMRDMVNTAIEIDRAMTQLKIVTGSTDAQMTSFLSRATGLAKELGQSVTDILSSIETFSRLGYNLEDSSILAKYSAIMSNVAGVSNTEATTGITSIIKGYGMEVADAEHVADVLVEVGQKYAVSASELLEAYEKSGAALSATNTSFEKSAGLIAAANAAVQNSSTVGTALKTISARIRGSKSELAELGEDTEELVDGFSKYANELKQLTNFDIMVEGSSNTFKDIYDIFEGISGTWDKLSDTQQSRVAEILGGTRQLQVVSSILMNWKDAAGAYSDAMDSAGVATEANSVYMDSIQGHLSQMQASFQELSTEVVNSGLTKGIIDIGTAIINVFTWLQRVGLLLPVIIASVLSIKAMKTANMVGDLVANIANLVNSTNVETAQINELTSAYMNLNRQQRELIQNRLTNMAVSASDNVKKNIDKIQSSFNGVDAAIKSASAGAGGFFSSLKATVGGLGALSKIGLVISAVTTLWSVGSSIYNAIHKSNEELIQDAENLKTEYQSASDSISSDLKTLRSMQGEFNTLSEGVSEYGENISLTASEYERYRDMVETILGISPSLISGYDEEGNAIARKNGLLEESIKLMEKEQSLKASELVSDDKLKTLSDGAVAVFDDAKNNAKLFLEDFALTFGNLLYEYEGRQTDFRVINGNRVGANDAYDVIRSLGFEGYDDYNHHFNDVGYSTTDIARRLITEHFDEFNNILQSYRGGGLQEYFNDEQIADLAEAARQYQRLRDKQEQAASELNSTLQLIPLTVEGYQKLSNAQKEFLSSYINSFKIDSTNKSQVYEAAKNFKNQILSLTDLLSGESSDSNNLRAVIELGFEIQEPRDMLVAEYQDKKRQFREYLNSIEDPDVQLQVKAAFGIESDDDAIDSELDEKVKRVTEYIDDQRGDLQGEVRGLIKSLSLDEIEILYKIEAAPHSLSIDEFQAKLDLAKIENVQASPLLSGAEIVDISSHIEKAVSIYNTAMKQMAEGGRISQDVIKSMDELGIDYSKYVTEQGGVLRMDAEAYLSFVNTLSRNQIDPLEEDIRRLRTAQEEARAWVDNNPNASREDILRAKDYYASIGKEIAEREEQLKRLKALLGDVMRDAHGATLSDSVYTSMTRLYETASKAGDSYTKLKDAVDEFNSAGKISGATMKSLADSGLLQFLEKTETGYRINTDALFSYTNELLDTTAETMKAAMAQDIYNLAIDNTGALSPIAQSALSKYRSEIVNVGNDAVAAAAKLDVFGTAQAKANAQQLILDRFSTGVMSLDQLMSQMEGLNKQFSGDNLGPAQAIIDAYKALFEQMSFSATDLLFGGGSGESSSSSAPWQQEIDALEHQRAMELINEEEYYNALLDIRRRYFDKASSYKDDWESLEESIFSQARTVADDWFNDQEHRITMLENSEASADEIVAVYQSMVNRVNDLLDASYKYGLDENNEYVQQLLDNLKEYTDSITAARIAAYEKSIKNDENKITLTENWMDAATEQKNYANVDTFSRNIISYYRHMQDTLHAEAQVYRDKGLSDTSDEISALSDKWWEYEKNIKEVKRSVLDSLSDMVSEANDIVDGFENVYRTLTDAAREYAEHGFLSADSLQSILDLGPQYLEYLQDENGQLVVNEAALQDVIRAKTEQLAADAAVAYAKKILYASETNDIEALRQLTQANIDASDSSFQYAYSVLEIARAIGVANGQSNELYDNALSSIRKMESLGKTAAEGVSRYWQQLDEEYVSEREGIESVFDLVKEMIRWENEEMRDALAQQKEDYGDIVSLRKEALDVAKKDSDYNDDVAEKIEKIARLQARINTLSLDDSRDAQAQKIKLEEEMRDLQKDLNKTQSDYAIDSQKDALDKMQEQYEDQKDDQIKALERELSSEEKLNRAARERISINWGTLYTQLKNWNYEYGNTLQSELENKWDSATEAVERYGGALKALDGVKGYTELPRNPNDIIGEMKANSLNWFIQTSGQQKTTSGEQSKLAADLSAATGRGVYLGSDSSWHYDSPTGEKVYTLSNDEIVKYIVTKMKANAKAWSAADSNGRQSLEEQNAMLGARLERYLNGVRYDSNTGVWYVGNEKLFDKYHSGGIVGGNGTFKQNEVLGLLEKGETVLDKRKETGLYRLIDFATMFMERFGRAIDTSPLLKSVTQMNSGLHSLRFATPNVGEARTNNVHFGDVYIYGANEDTLEKHREINRQFTSEVLRHLGAKT